MKNDKQPWEYHPDWESSLWHGRFHEFYLEQDGRRTLVGAYRNYVRTKKGHLPDKPIKNAPSSWRNAAKGLTPDGRGIVDKKGKPIAVPTWEMRAAAYDEMLRSELEQFRRKQEPLVLERQLNTLGKVRDKWEKMFRAASLLTTDATETIEREIEVEIDGEKRVVTVDEQVTVKAFDVQGMFRLIKSLKEISLMELRALNLPEHINQNRIADSAGGEFQGIAPGLADLFAAKIQEMRRGNDEDEDEDE